TTRTAPLNPRRMAPVIVGISPRPGQPISVLGPLTDSSDPPAPMDHWPPVRLQPSDLIQDPSLRNVMCAPGRVMEAPARGTHLPRTWPVAAAGAERGSGTACRSFPAWALSSFGGAHTCGSTFGFGNGLPPGLSRATTCPAESSSSQPRPAARYPLTAISQAG